MSPKQSPFKYKKSRKLSTYKAYGNYMVVHRGVGHKFILVNYNSLYTL